MKRICVVTLVVSMGLTGWIVPAWGQAPRFDGWKIVGPGGGGTMIDPTISPHDPALVVEHCDMTGAYITHDNGNSWRMFNLHGVVQTFAFDPSDKNVIYAGNVALWRSTNQGKSWSMVFPDPRQHTVLHQVGDESDLFLTTEDKAYPGPGEITAIAVDPGNSRRIYIAFRKHHSTSAVYTSGDHGASWKQLASIPGAAALLTFHDGNLIVVVGNGTYSIGKDGHEREIGPSPARISVASAAHARNTTWLYATTNDGKVLVSEDSGKTWRDATPSLGKDHPKFHAIAVSGQHPKVAYVGFQGWLPSTGKQHGEVIYAGGSPTGEVVWGPGPGNWQEFDGIAKTEDAGKTWKVVFEEPGNAGKNFKAGWFAERASEKGAISDFFVGPWSLGAAPTDPKICYATDLFRTYRTLDGGKTWQQVYTRRVNGNWWTTRGLDVTTSYGMQFDPFNSKHIYMDNTDIGLFQSEDGGASWKGSTTGVPERWRNTTYWLAFDPKVKGLVWGAFSGMHDLPRTKDFRHYSPLKYSGGVGVSTDGGWHWTPSNQGMPSTSITYIVMDPRSPVGKRTLYATAFGRGVYKSVDNGKSWTLENKGIEGAEPFAWRLTLTKDGTLYLVLARRSENGSIGNSGDGALYKSTNGADSWTEIKLPQGVNGPTTLSVDPTNPQRLYLTAWGRLGTDVDLGGGVFLSTNGGQTWKPIFQKSQHVYSLTIDPRNPHVLYITGFDYGAYRSVDSGAHWSRIKGYNFKWGHRVIPDPNDPSKIYINTYGGGVWHGPAAGDPDAQEDILTPIPVAQ